MGSLGSFALFLTVIFLAYVALIMVPFVRHKDGPLGDAEVFSWHFFIPCRDEESVIANTIERARSLFPYAHVWVIDDDSHDETASITQRFVDVDSQVHLVRRTLPHARTGKGDALNAAYLQLIDWLPADAERERILVGVVDADGELAENSLAAVAAADVFGNPRVGAAQITVRMKNRDDKRPYPAKGRLANLFASYLIRMQDAEFRTVIPAMQSLRSQTGTVGLGGNGQFTRLSVLDEIGAQFKKPWHGTLLEDYELGLHVLFAGYENRSVRESYVAQEALPSLARLITQRARWAQGNMQCIKYLKQIVGSPHFESIGVLESAYYLVLPILQMIGFVVVGALMIGTVVLAVIDPSYLQAAYSNLWATCLIGLIFGAGPFLGWGALYKLRCEPTMSWFRATGVGFGLYFFQLYLIGSTTRAFVRILLRRNGWLKTRRNADAPTDGPVALES